MEENKEEMSTAVALSQTGVQIYGRVVVTCKPRKNPLGGKQWLFSVDGKDIISVIGGGSGTYGDGVKTFEMWDYREEDVHGWMTVQELEKHIVENPLV